MKKITKILAVMLVMSFVLSACSKSLENSESSNISDTSKTSEKNISPLASDPEFMNSIHLIRNPETNNQMIIKGDGTVLLKTIRPGIEYLSLEKDSFTGEVKYLTKTISGDEAELKTYTYDNGEKHYYYDPKTITTFYDTNGNDIGLDGGDCVTLLVAGDKIFYNDYSDSDENDKTYFYNVTTGVKEKASKSQIGQIGSYILMSDSAYGFTTPGEINRETLVCDQDLNVIKTIEGYNYAGIEEYKDIKIAVLSKVEVYNHDKDVDDMEYNVDYSYKYNYLDKDGNLLLDEPVDERQYFNESEIMTLHRGDIEFDYDFKKMEMVGDYRPYKGYSNYNDKVQQERASYEQLNEMVRKLDDKYTWVETRIHGTKVLFFAHYQDENYNYDDPVSEYKDPCDVYSVTLELLGSFNNYSCSFDEEGYFLVNYDTLYNYDMEVVKVFDEKTYLQRCTLRDLVYYKDSLDHTYSEKPYYNIYDKDMNILYENVRYDSTYAFDDEYLVVAGDKYTRLYDDKLNVVKEYDEPYEIRNWYEGDYRVVYNLDTKRCGVMDKDYNVIIKGIKNIEELEEKSFTFENGFRYGLMDYDAKVICSFSIFDSMTEDSNKKDYDIRFVE